MSFENDLKKLDSIVKKLESGDISLEKAAELYSEGMKISAGLKKDLESAKLKIVSENPDTTAETE